MLLAIKKEKLKSELKELVIIFGCGTLNGILICPSCINNPPLILKIIGVSCFVWLIMWKGNAYTSRAIDRFYSWLDNPVKRLVLGVIGHTIYTTLAVLGLYYGLNYAFGIQLGKMPHLLIFSVLIALFVSTVMHSREFLISWRAVAIESEKMKKETITSKYETLKNQVNPHFLFNSLNALSNLIYEDQDQAAKFVKKLSEVYRYVLESRDKELVELSTEIEFVKSYIFLQKIRFQDNLQVEMKNIKTNGKKIIPLALQMLLENAIKHNEISDEHPLTVIIEQTEDHLIVSNNIKKKNILKGDSSEVGLSNIKSRYTFLTEKEVKVSQSEGQFIVQLPLLSDNISI